MGRACFVQVMVTVVVAAIVVPMLVAVSTMLIQNIL